MNSGVDRALNDAVVHRLAGEQSYRKGHDYYQQGRVEFIDTEANGIRAVVRGTQDYTVALSSDDGVLDYGCDCPQGADGAFCKHCVAVALAWMNRDISPSKLNSHPKVKEPTLADAAKVLGREDKDTLLRMMLDWANDDHRLQERLLHYAARQLSPESGVAAARQTFDRAVRVHGFIHYRQASAWARGVEDAINNIANLLEDGHAPAVIELCESALRKLARASGSFDDSAGHLSVLRDRLEEIHFCACREAKPDPISLARRLLDFELNCGLDIFFRAAERYSKILGAPGLKAYRQLAEEEWKKVPPRTTADHSEWASHFHITQIMESLAKASGDTEALVAVMSRDLSHAYNYLRIAEEYREVRQHDMALIWAEKGLKAFPERTDPRLREFVADEYHRRQRHEDALELIWKEFSEGPGLGTYQKLERHANKSGNWPQWRERALAEIRRRIAKAREESGGQARPRWMPRTDDHSQLVEIYLYESDIDAAWREAHAGGCSDRLWLQLAAAREKEHPAEAAPIYLKQAETAISATSDGRYEDAVRLLVKGAALMKRIGASSEFVRKLEALRTKFKIKRNFIKLVEQKRKLLYL